MLSSNYYRAHFNRFYPALSDNVLGPFFYKVVFKKCATAIVRPGALEIIRLLYFNTAVK